MHADQRGSRSNGALTRRGERRAARTSERQWNTEGLVERHLGSPRGTTARQLSPLPSRQIEIPGGSRKRTPINPPARSLFEPPSKPLTYIDSISDRCCSSSDPLGLLSSAFHCDSTSPFFVTSFDTSADCALQAYLTLVVLIVS